MRQIGRNSFRFQNGSSLKEERYRPRKRCKKVLETTFRKLEERPMKIITRINKR